MSTLFKIMKTPKTISRAVYLQMRISFTFVNLIFGKQLLHFQFYSVTITQNLKCICYLNLCSWLILLTKTNIVTANYKKPHLGFGSSSRGRLTPFGWPFLGTAICFWIWAASMRLKSSSVNSLVTVTSAALRFLSSSNFSSLSDAFSVFLSY